MKDMKLTEEEKKQSSGPVEAKMETAYPYGLVITLDENSLEKLGLSSLPDVDDELGIVGVVKVTSVSSNESGDGKRQTVQLQITHLELGEAQESDEERSERQASKLYGGA